MKLFLEAHIKKKTSILVLVTLERLDDKAMHNKNSIIFLCAYNGFLFNTVNNLDSLIGNTFSRVISSIAA